VFGIILEDDIWRIGRGGAGDGEGLLGRIAGDWEIVDLDTDRCRSVRGGEWKISVSGRGESGFPKNERDDWRREGEGRLEIFRLSASSSLGCSDISGWNERRLASEDTLVEGSWEGGAERTS
jgi:hypothetical protein